MLVFLLRNHHPILFYSYNILLPMFDVKYQKLSLLLISFQWYLEVHLVVLFVLTMKLEILISLLFFCICCSPLVLSIPIQISKYGFRIYAWLIICQFGFSVLGLTVCNVIGLGYWLSRIASFKRMMAPHMMLNSMVMVKMLCCWGSN